MSLEIKRIETEQELKRFIDFRTELYKDDEFAVPYLFMDEHDTLSRKNPSFAFCDAEYYMAYRDGKAVGRIAAIINHKANKTWNRKSVRFGFFDFVDDMEVSKALIGKVKEYGKTMGMEQIIGPMGFTDMEREGMKIEGFDYLASMHANHNYEYYRRHMEAMKEFEKDNDWLQYEIKIPEKTPEKFQKIADHIKRRYNLKTKKLTKNDLVKNGYGIKLFHILNECYKDLYEYSELSDQQIESIVKNYIGIADTKLLSFVVDANDNDKLVGFGVSFPSFSKALRKTKTGKLFPFGWYHLAKTLFFHNTDTVDLLLIGIIPEYRAKGANALIFEDLIKNYNNYNFKKALAMPMMETNNGVLGQWQYLESRTVIRLRSYKASLME